MRRGLVLPLVLVIGWLHASVAQAQLGTASPGKLAPAHAAFENQCDRCHIPFKGIANQSCLSCHRTLADRLAAKTGYHATVADKPCTDCHKDHRGATSLSAPVPRNFDHGTSIFPLLGKHTQLACARCHTTSRWVGTPSTCVGCHADTTHKGGFGSDCARCHGNAAWKPTTRTLTNHKTTITGGHAGLTCTNCHKLGQHLASTQSCANCHAQKHGGTKVECSVCHTVVAWKKATFVHDFCTCKLPGKHQTAPCLSCHPQFRFKPTPFECAACHDKERTHEPLGGCSRCHSALSWKTKTFDHDRKTKFPITGQHTVVACENCHTTKGKFRIASRSCESCHAVPAHGDFGGCAKCHSVSGFKPSSFDHSTTRMPLDGAHLEVSCRSCHDKLSRGSYVPGPTSCRTCHTDPHRGQFEVRPPTPNPLPGSREGRRSDGALLRSPDTRHTISEGRPCLDCHLKDRWTPTTIDAANHRDLGYPLVGAHAKAACARCHPNGTFAGTTQTCANCHVDRRHRGRFGTACNDCHTPIAWKPVAAFDHQRTGFALERGHAKVGCMRCHGQDGQRLATSAAPKACQSCHAAIHGKQFGESCTSCHSTASFRSTPPFDHTAKTSFPLELRHRAVPCEGCHDVRKRPTVNRTCRTCHGDPHRGSNSIECLDCHRADRWRVIRFDHDLTDYPLVGRHRTAACTECHTNPNWTGLRTDCLACHAIDRPRTQDHLTLVHCDDCHNPTNWRSIRRR